MSNLVPFEKQNLPTNANTLSAMGGEDDLSSGVSGGFGVISFRGSKWRVKHNGEETLLLDKQGETMPSIRLLILKGNKYISKNYYEGKYVEGSTDSPTCWSLDGIHPDAAVENPVSPNCAACPKNQFGSRITDSGSKAKACSDTRRLAVVPEGDYENSQFGGPLLLRVPAASLTELAQYGRAMKAKGFPYNTVITRVSFDTDAAYPKLKFNAVRPINDEEATEVTSLLQDSEYQQKLEFILAQAIEVEAPPAAVADDPTEFEEPVPVVAEAPKPRAARAVKAAVTAAPVPDAPEEDVLDDELKDILSRLDDLG